MGKTEEQIESEPTVNTCPECRYCLSGLRSNRCPECGARIDLSVTDKYVGSIWPNIHNAGATCLAALSIGCLVWCNLEIPRGFYFLYSVSGPAFFLARNVGLYSAAVISVIAAMLFLGVNHRLMFGQARIHVASAAAMGIIWLVNVEYLVIQIPRNADQVSTYFIWKVCLGSVVYLIVSALMLFAWLRWRRYIAAFVFHWSFWVWFWWFSFPLLYWGGR